MQGRIKKKKRALSEASQKTKAKFSKIVETAADLPLAPKNKQKTGAIQAAAKRKKAQPETLPTSATPMAEISSASAGQASLLSSPGLVMPGDDMLSAFYSIMMAEALIETNLTFDAPFSSNPTGVSDDHPSSLTTSATAAIIIDPVISNPMAPAIALDKAPSATSSVSAAILPPANPSVPTAPLGTSLSSNSVDASDDLHSSLPISRPAIDLINTENQPPLPEGLTEKEMILDLSFLDSPAPSPSPDETPSATSSISAPILPPAGPPLPTAPLGTSLSSNPAGASDVSASHRADHSEQTLAQIKTKRRLARSEADRKARAERRWKAYKLFNIYTGKPAPEGASLSEQYINFYNYVRRHVPHNKRTKTTYVNDKTGELADGITQETHQRGQHATLYNWLVRQKNKEFSKILEEGGDLPPLKTSRPAIDLINTAKQPSLLAGTTKQKQTLELSFLDSETPSTSPDKIPSAASSVNALILPPASHPLTSPLDMSLNLNPDEAFDASAHTISSPMISSTDQASPLPSLDLEEFVDHMLLAESLFAAESDTSVLASLTESDLTAKTATTTGEPLPLLSENPIQKPVERDLDLYFSEPVTTRPAFSALPTTPLYAYSAEAADAVIRSELDPATSAEQDSFAQDTSRKKKPNVHSFFQPKENDHVGHARRKTKTMPSDGSVEHPLPEADISDSISEVLFIPSPSAKKPAF